MDWYPNKRRGLLCGLALLAALLLVEFLLAWSIVGSPVSLVLYLRALALAATLPALAVLAYGYYGLANLSYRIERNGIAIRWGLCTDLVPMDEILEIVPSTSSSELVVQGVGWPGYHVGAAHMAGVGPARFYTTRPLAQSLVIRTRERAYFVSPANVDGFVADYRARRKLGALAQWTQGPRLPWLMDLTIWRDRMAGMLALPSLALNLGLFGYLAARYPQLSLYLALSYDLQGRSDRIGARSELFILPAVGLAIMLLNAGLAAWLHRKERVLALLLLGSSPIVQALLWLAALRFAR